jgi:hypothetical protein
MSYEIDDIDGLPAVERSWRIEILANPGEDYRISADRERVSFTPTGAVARRLAAKPTSRLLSQISTSEYSYDGITLTGAQLAGLISSIGDSWKLEDDAA